MRLKDKLLLGIWALLPLVFWGVPAEAQGAPVASTVVNLNWTAPTKNTDGSAIVGALTYNLYQGPAAGPYVKVLSNIVVGTTTVTSLAPGSCFWVSAVEGTVESSPTGPVCALQPGSPGGVAITITVTIK